MGGNYNLKIKGTIQKIFSENDYSPELADVVIKLDEYRKADAAHDSCHALSSVLFVALSELGYHPKLIIGECQHNGKEPFDHSWVTLDGMIIDIAPDHSSEDEGEPGIVILDTDIRHNRKYTLHYGINSGLRMSSEAVRVMNSLFPDYMSGCPWEKHGLWTVLEMIMPNGYEADIPQLKSRYQNVQREFIR